MCNVKLIACTVLYGKWKQKNKMGVVGARGFGNQYSSIDTAREVFLFFFYRAKISSCTAIHESCRHSSIYGHYTLQVCVLRLGDFDTASTNIVLHKYLNFRSNSVSGGHISVAHCPG